MTFPAVCSIDDFGGLFVNAEPVTDPTTDMDADQGNAAMASVAAMTATCDIAWMRFVGNATTPVLAPTNSNNAAWGNDSGDRPLIVHSGTGIYDATWPASIVDGTGATQSVNIKRATARAEGSTCCPAQTLVTSANTVRIYTFNAAGSLNDCVGVIFHVEVG